MTGFVDALERICSCTHGAWILEKIGRTVRRDSVAVLGHIALRGRRATQCCAGAGDRLRLRTVEISRDAGGVLQADLSAYVAHQSGGVGRLADTINAFLFPARLRALSA